MRVIRDDSSRSRFVAGAPIGDGGRIAGMSAAPGSIGSLFVCIAQSRSFVAADSDTARNNAVADRADITRAEAKRVLAAFEEVVLEELGNAQKVRIGGLVQLTVRVKPAQKARKGRNPATGEEITIAKQAGRG